MADKALMDSSDGRRLAIALLKAFGMETKYVTGLTLTLDVKERPKLSVAYFTAETAPFAAEEAVGALGELGMPEIIEPIIRGE